MAYQTTGSSPIHIHHLCSGWQIEAHALGIFVFAPTLEEVVAKFAIAFKDVYAQEKSVLAGCELRDSDVVKAIQKVIRFVD